MCAFRLASPRHCYRPVNALRCFVRCLSDSSAHVQQSSSHLPSDATKGTQLRTGNSFRGGFAGDARGSPRPSTPYHAHRTSGPASGQWPSPPPTPLPEPVSKQEHILVLQQLLSSATASSAELKRIQLAQAAAHVKSHDFDTGSTSVQLLRLCARIKQLKEHLAVHKKDHVTARSLNALEEQRFSLLAYLKRTESSKYESVLQQCFTPKELRILANDKWRKYLG
jgi:small subunit ribosomal protein S15